MALVKPKGSWRKAVRAVVKVGDKTYNNVPIYRARWTSADLSLHKHKYKDGIVFVFAQKLPDDDREVDLPEQIGPKGKYDMKFKIDEGELQGKVYLHSDTNIST